MWQVLLAAAVGGSTGFIANHFLTQTKQCAHNHDDSGITFENPNSQPPVATDGCSGSGIETNSDTPDGIFRFSSSESLRKHGLRSRASDSRQKPLFRRRRSKDGVKIAKMEQKCEVQARSEQSRDGKRLSFCLKRRKTIKNVAGKTGFCSSKDGSLFGWGLGFGIMYMMSTGKSEISKVNKTMDETAKAVQELKSELHRRRSSRTRKISDSVDHNDSPKLSDRNEMMRRKTSSEVRHTDARIPSLPAASDDGECGSSALTEESGQPVPEMDQLEAELELELQKLPGCTLDSPSLEEMRPKLHELQVGDDGCDGTEFQGVLAPELSQRLNHLLIERQEDQIAELESELDLAQSKLHEKEAELQALKDTVRRLSEISLSTLSDDETDAGCDKKGSSVRGANNMDCASKQCVAGVKRPIDSEACAYYYLK
ncbi:uncharacterized protein LOC114732785 [Neltuma alba]|uniref:uncharacterized protein LOC114732785 n=1 Tax=Neltuma alba TaxID=207710 RepID=UPI0010A45072|nr:uncharacterized protein LOC114732785 [Prosopis alba]